MSKANSVYDFGIRLKTLREAVGLSQSDVANKLNVSIKTISAYERNIQTPRLERLIKMARLYHASLDYMVNISDRTSILLDDTPLERQKAIIAVIDVMRAEFERCDNQNNS